MAFRFGLIGAGVAAELHVPAMRAVRDVDVVAVADVDRGRAQALADRLQIPEVYESTEALLENASVDALAILSPHHLHLPAVQAAVREQKHVLVEKAFAHTVEAADKMIEFCRAGGVTLGGIFQYRFTPAARALKETVRRGVLGRIFLASVSVKLHRTPDYYARAPWRGRKDEAGGGVLMIQAIHTLDLLLWVMGMPRRVFARTANAVHRVQVEDLAVGLLEYPDGFLAVLQATTGAVPENPPELEIHGDRGTAATFDSRGHLLFWSSTLDQPVRLADRWRMFAAQYREQEGDIPSQATTDPHAENIRDFVDAVQEGRSPLVDGIEARKALVVIDALYRSAEYGTWVDLP
jgi:UDP-N-acetyl-2-amino-2-deoxyglucuronate dehydrogenase